MITPCTLASLGAIIRTVISAISRFVDVPFVYGVAGSL